MFSKTTLALSAAIIVLSTALPALAATKHHHRGYSGIYNTVPDNGCPANGGPSCSNAGPAPPDSW